MGEKITSNTTVQVSVVIGLILAIAAGAFQAGSYVTRLQAVEARSDTNSMTLEQLKEIATDNKRRLDIAESQ